MRRFLRPIAFWMLVAALAGIAWWLERQRSETIAGGNTEIHVIDGDSLRIAGREVRLAGIDAPEYRQTCSDAAGTAWPCGREARTALERIVRGGVLTCQTAEQDRYGRALALCKVGEADVATLLARQGWADGAGDSRFAEPRAAITDAKQAKRGIWRGSHQHPGEWRKAQAGT